MTCNRLNSHDTGNSSHTGNKVHYCTSIAINYETTYDGFHLVHRDRHDWRPGCSCSRRPNHHAAACTPYKYARCRYASSYITTQLHPSPPHLAARHTMVQPLQSHSVLSTTLFQQQRGLVRGVTLPRTSLPSAPPFSATSPITF